jgi:hypothetical protein
LIGALALALFAHLVIEGEALPPPVQDNPAVELDPCLDVDETRVRNAITLELPDLQMADAAAAISVRVHCTESGQEIRVEPWASLGQEGTRTLQLSVDGDADPAARDARSRELALAIAELIRRLQITHPLASQRPPPPQARVSANPESIPPPPPSANRSDDRWQIAVQSSFETFAGGQRLGGADLSLARRIGHWIIAEARVGGRLMGDQASPSGRLQARGGTAALGAGLDLSTPGRVVGGALLVRAQGYLIQYRAEASDQTQLGTALAGAFVVSLEPRLIVAFNRRVSLVAAVGAGVPVHGIQVRAQGGEANSLTGLYLSGTLGAVLTL